MIEKLNPNDWDMLKVIDKINEIIDHLPQEKEEGVHLRHCNQGENIGSCKYGEDNVCPALNNSKKIKDYWDRKNKQPTREPQEKDYCYCFNPIPKKDGVCMNCGYEIKQPTKEVPDIRPILEKFYSNTELSYVENLNQTAQEISALYTRGNK